MVICDVKISKERDIKVGEKIIITYRVYNDEEEDLSIESIKYAIPPGFTVLESTKSIDGRTLIVNETIPPEEKREYIIKCEATMPGEFSLAPILNIQGGRTRYIPEKTLIVIEKVPEKIEIHRNKTIMREIAQKCSFFYRKETYQERIWLENKIFSALEKKKLVVLKAFPGAGKTTLMAKISMDKAIPIILIGKAGFPRKTEEIIAELARQIEYYWGIRVEENIPAIIEALNKIADWSIKKNEEKPLIILDGIDEGEEPEKILDDIVYKIVGNADVKMIITVKTGIEKIDNKLRTLYHALIDLCEEILIPLEKENENYKRQEEDVRKYLEKNLPEELARKEGYTEKEATKILAERSAGNFMIADAYIRAIEEGELTIKQIEKEFPAPITLTQWYETLIGIIEKTYKTPREEIEKFLAIITQLEQPITKKLIKIITGEKTDRLLRITRTLILRKENKYAPLHGSLTDYLKTKEIDLEEINLKIAEKIRKAMKESPEEIIDYQTGETIEEYAQRTIVTYYERAKEWRKLQEYVEEEIIPIIEKIDIEAAYRNINAAIKSLKHYPREERGKIEKLLRYAKTKTRIINPEKIPTPAYEALAIIAKEDKRAEKRLIKLIKNVKDSAKKEK